MHLLKKNYDLNLTIETPQEEEEYSGKISLNYPRTRYFKRKKELGEKIEKGPRYQPAPVSLNVDQRAAEAEYIKQQKEKLPGNKYLSACTF